ncbi:MAG: hypothetical protein JNK87_35345 [Bryobacterales bacterium]|nr:hypothetical protein [Bryobacterales bacterium]
MQAYSPEDCGHIRAQQQRIRERMNLESHTGAGAILTFLMEEELAGRGGSLDARTVAAAALGDSGRGSLVRVLKGDLAGKLLRYYAGPGKLDGILIRLPERGYRPLVYGRRPLSAQQESLYFHTACLLQLWALAQAAECLDRLSTEVRSLLRSTGCGQSWR